LSLRILAINPGGGSTKVGVYDNLKPVFEESIRHSPAELKRFPNVLDQYEMRRKTVMDVLKSHHINLQHGDTTTERDISEARNLNLQHKGTKTLMAVSENQDLDSQHKDTKARRRGVPGFRDSGVQEVRQDPRPPDTQTPSDRDTKAQTAVRLSPNAYRLPLSAVPFDAIVARGGTLKPLHSGIYRITRKVVDDIRAGNVQTLHASLLGPLIAFELAQMVGKPAWFVDPESTDEFWELSRLSGLPEIPRRALSHALSVKTVAKQAARRLGKPYERCNFVVAHLGTGITIAAHLKGRQVDASNANEDGPMAPQRSGAIPVEGLVDLVLGGLGHKSRVKGQKSKCLSPDDLRLAVSGQRKTVLDRVQRHGGLLAYLGTDDIREVETRIDNGDERAKLVYDAMIYQIAKEIGAYSCVLKGKIDAIVLTGGMTLSRRLVSELKRWIKHLAPRVIVFPGEEEMKALVRAVLRLHKGLEKERTYE
jgi:butyrate kinase